MYAIVLIVVAATKVVVCATICDNANRSISIPRISSNSSQLERVTLSSAQLGAWRTFITTHAVAVEQIEREMLEAEQLPLSSYDVLLALVEAPNRRLRMSELAEAVVLSRSGLTRLVDRLEKEGLLKRDRSGSDRRGIYAVLTLKGFRAFRSAWPVYAQGIFKYFVQHLSEEDLNLLTVILERVQKKVRE